MKLALAFLGALVVLTLLASHGAITGDACLGKALCAGAHGGSLTLHDASKP